MATGNNKRSNKNGKSFKIVYEGKKNIDEIINEKRNYKVIPLGKTVNNDNGNLLIQGDNLKGLDYLLKNKNMAGKIDLIYIDPPYGTNSIFKTRTNIHAYNDQLVGAEFIEFLRERLILLKELLSEKGSIYVHLDENMAFPIKIIMDEIFGEENFKNWITRIKSNNKNATKNRYGNISDYIMFYTKTKENIWNRAYKPWDEKTIKKEYPLIEKSTGRRYKKVPIHAPGIRNGETGKSWRGMLPPDGKHWQYTPEKLEEFDNRGEIVWSKTGNPRRKVYLDSSKGIPIQDIWDIKDAHHQSHKITGYPTEKNGVLLDRIILASSEENSIVLDCFAGSGTTLISAEKLGRKWIGIDCSEEAINTIVNRFENGSSIMGDYVNNNQPVQQTLDLNINDIKKMEYSLLKIE